MEAAKLIGSRGGGEETAMLRAQSSCWVLVLGT